MFYFLNNRTYTFMTDIDECEIGLVCPKPGTCINTIGSFRCEEDTPQCPPGFYFKESIQSCDGTFKYLY